MEQIYKDYIEKNLSFYHEELLSNIMPFWLEHGLDTVHGGIYTCLDRDGILMDSTKSVWFQGRFAFICAYAYVFSDKWVKRNLKGRVYTSALGLLLTIPALVHHIISRYCPCWSFLWYWLWNV